MLTRLIIQNYAIIDELNLELNQQLTIVTGETGAGKSILLGALGLILGERADMNVLYDKEKKCVVEGTFDLQNLSLKDFFAEHDLDFETHCHIRREIAPGGKSRAFINDTPVNLSVLKLLTEQLVDLHRQHQTLELNAAELPLVLVDALAENNSLLKDYASLWLQFKKINQQLTAIQTQQEQAVKEKDFLTFQLNELEKINLKADEQENLEQESTLLKNAESIKRNLNAAMQGLQNEEWSATVQLKNTIQALQAIKSFDKKIEELYNRLHSSLVELEDIANEIEITDSKIGIDEERMQLVTERLDEIYRLLKKHNQLDIAGLLNLKKEISNQLNQILTADEAIEELKSQLVVLENQLSKIAKQLSAKRLQTAAPFEKQVNELLNQVGMPHAQLKISIQTETKLQAKGIDTIQFLFAANKGTTLQDISKVASGGELSRLMLCLKTVVASKAQLPTLIFDEIDAGISGEVARKVGQLLQQLAKAHQIICITHLPQIAANGQSHYFVYKQTDAHRTTTHVKSLSKNERITEIAKMLSGDPPGNAALANAEELLG